MATVRHGLPRSDGLHKSMPHGEDVAFSSGGGCHHTEPVHALAGRGRFSVLVRQGVLQNMQLLAVLGIGVAIWWALVFLARFLPMKSHTRSRLLRLLAVVLIILIAGPEIGLGMEALAALNAMGAELFITSLIVGIRMLPIRLVLTRMKRLVEGIDPYFLVPSWAQIRDCPPIAVHAIPCVVCICLAVALWGGIQPDA